MSNELAHALRMTRERGARGILVDPAADEASAIAAFTSSGIERFAFVPALAAVICVGPPPMFRIVDDAFRAQLS